MFYEARECIAWRRFINFFSRQLELIELSNRKKERTGGKTLSVKGE